MGKILEEYRKRYAENLPEEPPKGSKRFLYRPDIWMTVCWYEDTGIKFEDPKFFNALVRLWLDDWEFFEIVMAVFREMATGESN